MKFNNFLESSSKIIDKLQKDEGLTYEEQILLKTVPINRSVALQIDLKNLQITLNDKQLFYDKEEKNLRVPSLKECRF